MSNNQDPIFAANSARRASQRKQGSGMGKRVANELCPTCHGAGSMAHTASSQPCRTCRGEGLIARTAEWDGASCKSCGKNNIPDARRCAHCGVPHPGDAPVGKKKASRRTAGRTSVEFYRGLGGAGYWTFYDLANNQYGSYESEAEAAAAATIWEEENPTMEDFLTAPGPYTLASRRTAANEDKPCVSCGKMVGYLEVFPTPDNSGVLCVDCYANSPEGRRMPTADEVVNMWGGPTRRRASRRTAADVTPNENGEKTLRNGWVNMKGEGKVFRPDLAQLLIDMAKADSGLLSEGGRKTAMQVRVEYDDGNPPEMWAGELNKADYLPMRWVIRAMDGTLIGAWPTKEAAQAKLPAVQRMFWEKGDPPLSKQWTSSRRTAGYRYMTADEVARWQAGEYFPGAEEDANGVLFSVTDPDMGDFGLGDDDDPAMILASRHTADQNFGPDSDSQSGFGESEQDWVTVDNATDDSNLGWISNEPEEAYEMDPGFGPFDDID